MTTQTTTTPVVSPLMEIALRIREMRAHHRLHRKGDG